MREQRNYINVVELAERTGLSISTINRLKSRGKISFYQPGGKRTRVLFPLNTVERAVSSQTLIDDATLSVNKPVDVNIDHADSPEGFALPKPTSETSRLPGPMPKWRKYRH
jgi:excisionase family DNA binding protein